MPRTFVHQNKKKFCFMFWIYGWDARGLFPHVPSTLRVLSEIIDYTLERGLKKQNINLEQSRRCRWGQG